MIQNGKYKLSIEHRLTSIESTVEEAIKERGEIKKDVAQFKAEFSNFRDNHFAHFKAWVYGGIISLLTGIIGILVTLTFK